MSRAGLEQIVVADFDENLEVIQDQLREFTDADSGISDVGRSVISYVLSLNSVDNINQAEIIHYSRIYLEDKNVDTALDVIESGNYYKVDNKYAKLHQLGDEVNSTNEKWISEDGRFEYIIRKTGDGYVIVDESINIGSFNFAPAEGWIGSEARKEHVRLDVNPWILFGNTPDDTALSFDDRLEWWVDAVNGSDIVLEHIVVGLEILKLGLIDAPTMALTALIDLLKETFQRAETTRSPLILDLDGDGVETLSTEANVFFDHDGNGFAERTGWVGVDDGLLVLDKNGDGEITDGSELFGNHHDIGGSVFAENGFAALATLDDNGDGYVDSSDAGYSLVRVWRDQNSNGQVDPGELVTLADVGVTRLQTDYVTQSTDFLDENGNSHLQTGSYLNSSNVTLDLTDVWFDIDTAYAIDQNVGEIPDSILALPNVAGFGNVASLHSAMAADGTGRLKELVEEFAADPDSGSRGATLLELLYRWADVYDIAPDAREASQIYGNAIGDARKLAVLEKFLGYSYLGIWCWGERDPNPHGPAASILLEAFDLLADYVSSQLSLQTHFKGVSDLINVTWTSETGRMSLDVSDVVTHLETLFSTDEQSAIIFMAEYAAALLSLGESGVQILDQLRSSGDLAVVGFPQSLASMGLSGTVGTAQNDVINGGSGNDLLVGFAGDDQLSGNDGDDVLIGGSGADNLRGGDGADVYRYNLGDGNDTINNFDQDGSIDVLEFGTGIEAANVLISRDYYDLILTVTTTGQQIRISSFVDQAGQSSYAIDTIRFASGVEWTVADIMAILNTPTVGDDYIDGTAANENFAALAGNDDVRGNGGDDNVDGGSGNDRVYGGDGDDTLLGGDDNDYLYGEADDDDLSGGNGNDHLSGGYGSDTYRFGTGFGQDTVDNYASPGGDDAGKVDTILFEAGIAAGDITVSRAGNTLYLEHAGTGDRITVSSHFSGSEYAVQQVVFADGTVWDGATLAALSRQGTSGNDYLVGSGGSDAIDGLAGNDNIRGGGGDDTLVGGDDNDFLYGEAGDDDLSGGSGNDYLSGGYGSDTYRFGTGFGQDTVYNYASSGSDVPGKVDTILFEAGITSGDLGVQRSGSNLILSILGTADRILVSSHFYGPNYAIQQVVFADGTVWDEAMIEALTRLGTSGNDYLVGSDGNDTLNGLAGRDDIRGREGDDTLLGGEDNDIVYGEAGDDDLSGGSGNDYLVGGYGSDTYRFGTGFGQDTVDNYAYAPSDVAGKVDRILFEAGIAVGDILVSRSYSTLYLEHAGTGDRITVSSHFSGVNYSIQQVEFADGTVWDEAALAALARQGTSGNDYLVGSAGNDVIDGLAGNDDLFGGEGDDTLLGGADNDELRGEAGDDDLSGGAGNDYLAGGYGSDTYRFGTGFGQDTIYNYASSGSDVPGKVDTILFEAGILPGDIGVQRSGSNLILSLAGTTDKITVSSHFYGPNYAIQQVVFADGTVWDEAMIEALTRLGTSGNDYLIGSDSDDVLDGLAGRDDIRGRDGDDTLLGGADNDYVYGEAGDDDLSGGTGSDYLVGGYGSDTYRFGTGFGQDTVDNYAYAPSDVAGKVDRILFEAGIAVGDILVSRSYGTLYLEHAGTGDRITVSSHFSGVNYSIQQVEFADGTVWDEAALAALARQGTSGNDYLVGSAGNDVIDGLAGNDDLFGGEGDDTLLGGADNDELRGEAGDDDLSGGAGNDYLVGGYGSDTYRFGTGFGQDTVYNYASSGSDVPGKVDTILFEAGILPGDIGVQRSGSNLILSLAGTTDKITVSSHFYGPNYAIQQVVFADGTVWDEAMIEALTRLGTSGNDYLIGSDSDDVLDGLAGRDDIRGREGDDTLSGGADNDYVYGEAGDDDLSGGSGNDQLIGGYGSDTYRFGTGFGQDTIDNYAYAPSDVAGKVDRILFEAGIAVGDILVSRSYGTLYLEHAGTGDRITVSSHFSGVNYSIQQVVFADGTVWDEAVLAALARQGTSGNDYLVGSDGNDVIDGLAGNDDLFGGEGDDTLLGGADNDDIRGDAGDDDLSGGTGNDYLVGGYGSDTYRFGTGFGQDTVYNYASSGSDVPGKVDTILFEVGIVPGDIGVQRSGNNLILSLIGTADKITVSSHFSSISYAIQQVVFADGTVWDETELAALSRLGTSGNDYLIGSDSGDTLDGLAVNDDIRGREGNDTLLGGADNDDIRGEAGDDDLSGGTGNDYLVGGYGSDTYRFGIGFGQDTVDNYASSSSDAVGKVDTILFEVGIVPGDIGVQRSGNNLILSLIGTADKITVSSHFSGISYAIQQVVFVDGTVWDETELAALSRLGTSGNDYLIGSDSGDTLDGLAGNDDIRGREGNDTLLGGADNDDIRGEAGDDDLSGGTGNDYLVGGYGSDTYRFGIGFGQDTVYNYASSGSDVPGKVDIILFEAGIAPGDVRVQRSGSDLVLGVIGTTDKITVSSHFSGISYAIQQVVFASGTVWDEATLEVLSRQGTPEDDDLIGSDSGDTLDGLAGNDDIRGRDGDDNLSGGDDNDYIYGEAGNDILRGGAGNDRLIGGYGSDTYRFGIGFGQDTIDNYAYSPSDVAGKADKILFDAGIAASDIAVSGSYSTLYLEHSVTGDRIAVSSHFSGANYSIQQVVFSDGTVWDENALLVLTDRREFALQNTMLRIVEDQDMAAPLPVASLLISSAKLGSNLLSLAGDDAALFQIINNTLYLKSGTVLDHDLQAQLSLKVQVTDASSGAVVLTSDVVFEIANAIEDRTGTSGPDILIGNDDPDRIYGQSGNDDLQGGKGHDLLDGGTGADNMSGGADNDTYIVDDPGDVVIEGTGEGDDIVYVSISYNVPLNVEVLIMQGTGNFNSTGTAVRDYIIGNAGENIINGAGGFDVMQGGAGNDTYAVDNSFDAVIEALGGGYDNVYSSVDFIIDAAQEIESAILTGNAVVLRGDDTNNQLFGNDQINVIDGRGGTDYMLGLGGNDIFQITPENGAVDVIGDFANGPPGSGDRIAFSGFGPGATVSQVSAVSFLVASADNSIVQQFLLFDHYGAPGYTGGALVEGDDYYFG